MPVNMAKLGGGEAGLDIICSIYLHVHAVRFLPQNLHGLNLLQKRTILQGIVFLVVKYQRVLVLFGKL